MENHQLIDDINKNGYPYIYNIIYIYEWYSQLDSLIEHALAFGNQF